MDENYTKELEAIIRAFLKPLRNVPYYVGIQVLTGCRVLHFDLSDKENLELLELLKRAAQKAGEEANRKGIYTQRPNEARNMIKPFVIDALNSVGLKASKPRTKTGKIKTAGYPDIEIVDRKGRTIYLDCKTYSRTTKNQSLRTFYFSPSEDPKITKDAFHLLLSFELEKRKRQDKMVFVPVSWQLYTLEKLKVQVKHEFNASNKDIYKSEFLLAEGKIE